MASDLDWVLTRTRDKLNDPQGTEFSSDALRAHIYESYMTLVRLMDAGPSPTVAPTPLTVTYTASGDREQAVSTTVSIGRILQIVPYASSRYGPPIPIVPWAARNDERHSLYGVYTFRDPATGYHYLGQCMQPTRSATYYVYYRPRLSFADWQSVVQGAGAAGEIFDYVSAEFHHVIASGAALKAKVENHRDPGPLASEWTLGLAEFKDWIECPQGRQTRRI
jgi:hypothetical protein